MIFVSDLDQTLIFSKKHIGEGLEDKVLPIEMKNEEIISYIHKEVLEKLRNLNDKLIFIPATTRTLEQYNRVQAFKEYLSPKYAIVNHGGSILVNGELDLKWQNHISDIVSKQCATLNYIKEMFKNKLYNEEWVIDIRQVEDLFLYC
ncbi:MAG: HAD family hydrolase, partial [Bacillota bacterium]|nr:HAD family hydrolase [Bacillota bacterium]